MNKQMLLLKSTPDKSLVRNEQFEGRDHLVVPLIALVEGVVHPSNAPTPELALAAEFARYPSGWDGRPVVLGHPQIDNQPVSANSPDVLALESFGKLFNTLLEDGKLKTEAWIDLEKLATMEQSVQDSIARFQDPDAAMVEVSTGVFVSLEEASGVYGGDSFDGIWRGCVPDHLAILPEGAIGACSTEMGAGGPRINKEGSEEPCSGALSSGNSKENPEDLFDRAPFRASVQQFLKDLSISDKDTRSAVEAALITVEHYFYILAIYPEEVIYYSYDPNTYDDVILARSYRVEEGGDVFIGNEAMQVRPETKFVPVKIREIIMDKAQQVTALIQSDATQYTQDDNEWLMALEESQLEKMQPPIAVEPSLKDNAAVPPVVEPVPAVRPVPVTLESYVAAAPTEIQEVLGSGLALQQARRSELVKALSANEHCQFNETELQQMSMHVLEKTAALGVANYAGLGIATPDLQINSQSENEAPEPIQCFAAAS